MLNQLGLRHRRNPDAEYNIAASELDNEDLLTEGTERCEVFVVPKKALGSKKTKAFSLFDKGKRPSDREVRALGLKEKTRFNYFQEWKGKSR